MKLETKRLAQLRLHLRWLVVEPIPRQELLQRKDPPAQVEGWL